MLSFGITKLGGWLTIYRKATNLCEIYLCELCESRAGRINIYRAIHYNAQNARMHKFYKRPVLTNLHSHKFVTCKNVALRYM